MRAGRSVKTRLVSLRVHVLGNRGAIAAGHTVLRLTVLKQLETSFDVDVSGVQVSSALIGVERVGSLVVAGFILEIQLACCHGLHITW